MSRHPLCLIAMCPFSFCLLPPNAAIPICDGMIQHKGHLRIDRHEVLLRVFLAFNEAAFLTNMRPCDVFASRNLIPTSKVRAYGFV